MPITALPTPPLRSDPTSFAVRGDAFMAALPVFVSEANALAQAMNLNSTTGTSTSSVLIGTGDKTFVVASGKSFQPGMYLVIADATAPSGNSMWGQVTSYSGTSLVMDIKAILGSGTKASWVISQSAPGGAKSGANADITSLAGLTTALSVVQGGTGGTTASAARTALGAAASGSLSGSGITGAAASGANADITSLAGLTTALSVAQGGTGSTTASAARAALDVLSTSEVATQLAAAVPAGAVVSFARNTPPTGWLKANGALLNRTTYASLFAAIGTTFGAGDGSTTFGLPDLRGEFVRGWDDARGVDSGRVFGSAQAGQNEAHTHTGSTFSAGDHTHTSGVRVEGGAGGAGAFYSAGSFNVPITGSAGAHTHTLSVAASGGAEARSRNVALLACIKY